MKTVVFVLVLCVTLNCIARINAARLDRNLKQSRVSVSAKVTCVLQSGRCTSRASVNTTAISEAVRTLATVMNTTIKAVEGGGDVEAYAGGFAGAVATALARIITSHVLTVYVDGEGEACSYTKSNGEAYANATAEAVGRAFAQASNDYVKAAAECYPRTVFSTTNYAIRNITFDVCTDYGYDFIYARIKETGYIRALARVFLNIFVSVRDNVPYEFPLCRTRSTAFAGRPIDVNITSG